MTLYRASKSAEHVSMKTTKIPLRWSVEPLVTGRLGGEGEERRRRRRRRRRRDEREEEEDEEDEVEVVIGDSYIEYSYNFFFLVFHISRSTQHHHIHSEIPYNKSAESLPINAG